MATNNAVKLSPSAKEDLKEAVEWYDNRFSNGLAARFINAVAMSLS